MIVLRAMEVGVMAVVKEVLDLLGSHNMFQPFLGFCLVVLRPDYTFEECVAFQSCESEAPFFGVSRKRKREKGGKSTPFFAVLIAD